MIGICLFSLMMLTGDTSTAPVDTRRTVSGDSAVIVSPAALTNLAGKSMTFRVEPRCSTTGAALLVRYYPWVTETIGVFTQPPYTATWDPAKVPDQDQFFIQLGYQLYHPGGDTIISPPTPHRWVIDRNESIPRYRYPCRRAVADSVITIDADTGDWNGVDKEQIGAAGWFRAAWTAGNFYLLVSVADEQTTGADRVEVMFDLKAHRPSFAGIEQRIISFGPRSRSFSWPIRLSESGSFPDDSIVMRIDEEMEWRARSNPRGYLIEARIPFCVLSDLEFPQLKLGFNLAVVDRDSDSTPQAVTVWSGSLPSNRHNPSEWGTVVLRQRMPLLKIALTVAALLALGVIALVLLLGFRQKHQERALEKRQRRPRSPLLEQALQRVETEAADPYFSLDRLAGQLQTAPGNLERAFERELAVSFSRHLLLARIRNAKELLRDPEVPLAAVAHRAGFSDHQGFEKEFRRLTGTDPQTWREQRLEEDDEEEEIDDA